MKIIYLIPRSGYVTDLRSDTLWGSICWGIRYLWGEKELIEFLQRCESGNPDFVISSAFPFKQHGKERVPFFPNPLVLHNASGGEQTRDDYRLHKDLKKINFLNYNDFKAALHGELTADDLFQRLADELARKKRAKEVDIEYVPTAQTVERTAPKRHDFSMTHNTIDRLRGGTLTVRNEEDGEITEAGQLFHAEDTWWTDPDNESDEAMPNTGLYFLADGDLSKLEPVLNLLRHWGIGADRSAGKGAFDFIIPETDFTMPEPSAAQSNALLNLSLFRPTKNELEALEQADGCLQYLLERREGYVGGHRTLHRKEARMYFREGSVFARPANLKSRYMGCIHEHLFAEGPGLLPPPPHRIWDNGFGFMVNLNWKKQ